MKDLKCVGCGRKAQMVLHGTSYCTPCGYKGLNKPAIPVGKNSPIEQEGKRHEAAKKGEPKVYVGAGPEGGAYSPWRSSGFTFSAPKKIAKVRRNQRRRALRKKRKGLQSRVPTP